MVWSQIRVPEETATRKRSHEPGTGEINYHNVFRAIRDLGFKGFVAMEYRPSKDPMQTLAEVKRIASN